MNHEAVPALTRADVELHLAQVENSTRLDLSLQNLRHINLSYMDLQGADLRGANLQRANLRGINLSQADLCAANLSDADLDGANLSRARLGENEANRANLQHAKLSHALLTDLDLRGFDLAGLDLHQADLNGTDLRGALLQGSDLSGADLSTALLHGSELHGAILHRGGLFGNGLKQKQRGNTRQQELASSEPVLLAERSSPAQEYEIGQTRKSLSDREAYILGEQALLSGAEPIKIRQLFPQGFSFPLARQFFDAWLTQADDTYNEQEIQAMWIGFAHRMYDLYCEDGPEE